MQAKIVLYYVFTPLADPDAVAMWQREACEREGLRGRIIVSPHGINGTVGGEINAVKRYVRRFKTYAPFRDVDMKWSDGTGLDDEGRCLDFPKLSVKVRDELVTFGSPADVQVDQDGVVGTGTHLSPRELHALVGERGHEVVFFDGRNQVEAAIGKFRDAIVPDTNNTRDFLAELDSGRYDHLKQRPIVTYCTGGIRCEVLSALMRERGFDEVYQIEGGIVRYGEAYGNDGLWQGSLAVFDGREHVEFGAPGTAAVIGECTVCGAATNRIQNCVDPSCHGRLVACAACGAAGQDALAEGTGLDDPRLRVLCCAKHAAAA
ncbi:rhodanese-related sulfurtransferase [Gulosibacter macacae]|uniref:tRNA uridine(34) hydroxylase n=1 Tax=Gulosibacter macacae TaxID=2488791 RepID=A0A3P3W2T0_9MICO|nr:rhodanese-related sulfurtransferase [Gulosibacter macacae]RRJ88688.1 rhodanese-related sulfurtransferase [Gulosibacter macacae]